jgi:hypothetical protein
VDHVALAGLHDAALLGHVDQLAQLDLGGERPVAVAAPGGDRVADEDQQRGDGPEDPPQQPDDAGRGQCDAVGVLPAEGARTDADQHVADDGHHAGGGRDGLDGRVPQVEEEQRHEDGGDRLEEDPQQEQQRHVAGAVLEHVLEGAGPLGTLPAHLLDAGLGHALQGGVHGGEQPRQRDQQDRHDEQGDRGCAHRAPGSRLAGEPVTGSRGAACQPSMSFCCRENISFSSCGSMWS